MKAAEGSYFPERAFHQDERRDRFVSNWYTRYLSEMNEPSLLTSHDDQNASYRFLWLRSFHPTVVVRLWSNGEKRMLSVKELKIEKKTQSKQLLVDQTRVLKDEEWAAIVRRVEESCFWAEPSSTDDPVAMDGAWWVLESADKGYYHVAKRQSPDSGSYRELCLYLLKLSGLPLDTSTELY